MKTIHKLIALAIASILSLNTVQAARIQATNLEAVRLVVPSDSTGASKGIKFTLDEALDPSVTLPSEITVTLDIPKSTKKLVNISPTTFTIPINTETGVAGESEAVEFSLKDNVTYFYKVQPSKALEELGVKTEIGKINLDLTSSSSATATPDSVSLGVPANSSVGSQSITATFDDISGSEIPSSGRVRLALGLNGQKLFHISPTITDISIDSTGKASDSEKIIFTLRKKINLEFRVLPDNEGSGLGVTKSRRLTIVVDADGEST